MKSLAMLFALVCCALAQALLPGWTAMGLAKAPLLLGLSLYYALHHDRRLLLQAAILAGLLQDALDMTPLGYSSFGFCLASLLCARFREVVFVQQGMTHALAGGLAAGAVTFLLAVLLSHDGSLGGSAAWFALKILGTMLLGALCIPLVFRALDALDRHLGNLKTGALR